MNRRLFVQTGISSLLLPGAMMVAPRAVSGEPPAGCDYLFFDQRFAEARHLAAEVSDARLTFAVQGDVTPIWTCGLARASLLTPLRMQGVTTESFYFCLRVLLHEQSRVDAQVRRLDRDLRLWTINTNNHVNNARMSWQHHSPLA